MKYHSTKNTILTIVIILTSFFIISFLGIKYLNAKTPIEAVAEALVENLELPSDYQIEINNINKSFLLNQKIDSIVIKKVDKVFLELKDVELKHSLLDYVKLFIFNNNENLLISANSIEINYNKYFYDIIPGLKNIKIRDNTFSRIKSDEILEPIKINNSFDLEVFREQIQQNNAINVSDFLPSFLNNSRVSIKINTGNINFDDNNFKANTMFKDFELNISEDSFLTDIKAKVTKFNLSNNSFSIQSDYAIFDFDKTKINIDCTNLLFINDEMKLGANSFNINYSLLDFERAILKYDFLNIVYKNTTINVEKGNSKIDSNFKDFSLYNSFDNLNLSLDNLSFNSRKIDFNASYVNKKLAIILSTGPKNNIRDKSLGNFDFNNLYISLSSDSLLPTDFSIMLENGEYRKDNNIININNFESSIFSNVNSSLYFNEDGTINFDEFNQENLKESYKEINATIGAESEGYIKAIDNDFETDIYSTFTLEDSFNQITATIDLRDAQLSRIDDELNVTLAYQGPLSFKNNKLKMLETQIRMGESIQSSLIASSRESIKESSLEGNIQFTDFIPTKVLYYVNNYIPVIANYVDNSTTVNGSINFSGKLDETAFLKVTGDVDSSLVLNNLYFGTTPINIGMSLSTYINQDNLSLNKFNIASFGYRLSASGIYDSINNLPSMNFEVNSIKNGTNLFTTSLYPINNKLGFNLLIPSFESFYFSGVINQLDESDIKFSTELQISEDDYPINVNINRTNLNISAYSDKGLDFKLDIGKSIKASLIFDNLFSKTLDNSYLDGSLNYSASDIGEWEFLANKFLINYSEGKIIFGFDSNINKNEIVFSNIEFKNNLSLNENNQSYYSGDFSYKKEELKDTYKLNPYSLNLSFGDGIDQNIDVVATNDGFSNHIFVDFSNVNFAPLFQLDDELIFNFRLIGNNNGEDINSFRGNINLYDENITTKTEEVYAKESNRITSNFLWKTLSLIPFIDILDFESSPTTNSIISVVSSTNLSLTSNIFVDGSTFSLSSLNFKAGDVKLSNADISLDTKMKEFNVNSSISYLKHSKNTNQNSSADLLFNLNFQSLFDNVKELYFTSVIDDSSKLNYKKLYNKIKELFFEKRINLDAFNGINGKLKIDNIEVLKDTNEFEKLWDSTLLDTTNLSFIDSSFFVENSVINIDGINLNGSVDLINKNLNIDVDKNFGIGLIAEFDYNNSSHNLFIKDLYLPVNLISNLLYYNLFKLYDGVVTGNLLISDINTNPQFFGTLNINNINANFFWVKDQLVSFHNSTLVAFGNDLSIKNSQFDVYNSETNTISKGTADLNIRYIKDFPLSVEIGLNIDDYVLGVFPLLKSNIWSEGYAKGTIDILLENNWKYIDGALIVKDAIIKGELEPIPNWFISSKNFNVNMEIQTGSNVTAYYPSLNNPILKTTLNKNQNFSLNIDNRKAKASADGKLSLAQGELFYFQKNFFINSGSISFDQDLSSENIKLLLSLNATLKEYDSEGNDVDINLILNNSSIDNLNPMFTSIPVKSTTEIMSILGQSVTGVSSDGSVKVGGLATAATSIFSSLGYINTGGVSSLNKTIAKTLNLDIFSLNSNIVENLLLDTLSVNNRNNNSPLARYLDNTSIYMGKYISNDSYLQLIINLIADQDSKNSSFLASDLKLDFEVTYDIDSPIAKFSIFTNPQQLSIIDILDTIGFSVTKTIYLR